MEYKPITMATAAASRHRQSGTTEEAIGAEERRSASEDFTLQKG